MMTHKTNFILGVLLFSFLGIYSQEYLEMMNSNNFTVQEIQKAAKAHFKIKGTDRGAGYKSFKRWEYNALRIQDEQGYLKAPSFYFEELEHYNAYKNKTTKINKVSAVAGWEELGPTNWSQTTGWNPGIGRITSIAIDASNEIRLFVINLPLILNIINLSLKDQLALQTMNKAVFYAFNHSNS